MTSSNKNSLKIIDYKFIISFTTTLVFLGLFLPIKGLAEEELGHMCAGNQCLSCTMGEEGCEEGVCNAFICESGDNIPPAAPTITNTEELNKITNGTSLRVRGYGESDTRVIVIIDGEEKYEGSVNSNGTFDVSFDPGITESGEHDLEVYLRDNQDNESDKSAVFKITVDATSPEIKISNIPDFTSFENILISGSTDPGSEVYAYKDRKEIARSAADTNGNFDLILSLTDGENKFNIKATDPAGNETEKEISINYDESSSNKLELITVESNKLLFSVPDEIVEIEVYTNDKLVDIVAVDSSEFEYDISSMLEGVQVEFKFVGIDQVGNKTQATTFTYSNSTATLLIVIGLLLLVGTLGFGFYLVRTGKLNIPVLRKLNPAQRKMKLKKEPKEPEPKKLKKEY
jgi:hypothetical protein